MNNYPIFKNAPIIEALLDIKVELSNDTKLENLDAFYENIKEKYTEKKRREKFTADIKFTEKGELSQNPVSNQPDAYIYRSANENKVIQIKMDGFTFNKLKPYEHWDKFYAEAKSFYEQYDKIARPIKITRIALRYINQIDLPLPFANFKEYILTIPEIAPELPQGLSGFFMQLSIPSPDINAIAIINQTMKPFTNDNKLSFIFDIDIFKNVNYNNYDPAIWEQFQKLRNFKNDIFLKSITDKTKELFK